MIQLLYVSQQKHDMSDNELLEMLDQARKKNKTLDITGILLYHNGYFMQLLEGPKENVDQLFDVIARDPRHKNVRLIGRYSINDRSFNEWNMGYQKLSESDLRRHEGFSDIFYRDDGKAELLKKPTILVEMLATLFQINS
jgi:hypothetical protein